MKRIGVLYLLGLAAVLSARADQGDEKKPPSKFRTVAVKKGSVDQVVRAKGTLEPEDVIDVGAQVNGVIRSLGRDPRDPKKTVDYTTMVEEGTVLAQLDDGLFRIQMDKAKAALVKTQAEARHKEAQLTRERRTLDRVTKGFAKKAATEEDVEAAKDAVEVAKADTESAKAAVDEAKVELKIAENNLRYTTIRSPVSGIIIDRRVNVGQYVVSSLNAPSLFLIARDLSRMSVWVSVDEKDIGWIKVGQTARFTVKTYPGKVFIGKVSQIRLNATKDQEAVTYTVVVAAENPADKDHPKGMLLPYMTTNVKFEVGQKRVLLVPNAALRWAPRSSLQRPNRVWVEDKGGLRFIQVTVGESVGEWTEVLDGLKEGQAVIVGEAEAKDKP
jgi:HlyD family secretion protein